jgi:antitoxin VapB
MSLNIKDPEVYRLAREIAQATGRSMTTVVRDALREHHAKLDQRRGRAGVEEILAIAGRVAENVRKPYAPHDDLLYDDRGLPR